MSGLCGLWLSRELAIAAGGAIGVVVTGVFLLALLVRGALGRFVQKTSKAQNFATVEST
ncbi:hypothetical protein [Leucobacter insecticola]|uniref:hypothetical protein n=1 Tax=Leucobacter insecticola TaxID=2714934 RepID=UPI00244DA95A|nr:hypothetical protein [Leucobacter insecticola]